MNPAAEDWKIAARRRAQSSPEYHTELPLAIAELLETRDAADPAGGSPFGAGDFGAGFRQRRRTAGAAARAGRRLIPDPLAIPCNTEHKNKHEHQEAKLCA